MSFLDQLFALVEGFVRGILGLVADLLAFLGVG